MIFFTSFNYVFLLGCHPCSKSQISGLFALA